MCKLFSLIFALLVLIAPASAQDTTPLTPENVSALTPIHTLGAGGFNNAEFLPNGKAIAVATRIGVSMLEIGSPDAFPPKLSAPREFFASALEVSADGSMIAAGGTDFRIYLWRDDESFLTELRAHGGELTALAFSPDGTKLASAAADSSILVWDTATFAEITRVEGLTSPAGNLVFTPDGQTLIAAQRDGVVNFYAPDTGEIAAEGFTVEGSPKRIALSPDGTLLAGVNNRTSNYWIWDIPAATWKIQASSPDNVEVMGLSFSGDGQTLYLAQIVRDLAAVNVSDGATTKLPLTIPNEQRLSLSLNSAGTEATLVTTNGLSVIDLATGSETARVNSPRTIYDVAFNPAGNAIAAATSASGIDFWSPDGFLNANLAQVSETWVEQVDYLPDNTLVTLDLRQNLKVGDNPPQTVTTLPNYRALAVGANGAIFTVGDYNTARISDSTGAEIGQIAELNKFVRGSSGEIAITSIAVNADETLAVFVMEGGAIIGYDLVNDGFAFSTIINGNDHRAAFSPDSTHLIVGGNGFVFQYTIDLGANSLTPTEGFSISDMYGLVKDLSYSPDGALIAAVGADNILHVWDSTTGATLFTSQTLPAVLTSLDFSPDGSLIVTSGEDGVVRIWGIE